MWPYDFVCVYYSHIKKEENAAIFVKMNGFWEHYAKWSKSDREREILYDLIYVELKKKKPWKEIRSVVITVGMGLWGTGIEWTWSKGTNFLV